MWEINKTSKGHRKELAEHRADHLGTAAGPMGGGTFKGAGIWEKGKQVAEKMRKHRVQKKRTRLCRNEALLRKGAI